MEKLMKENDALRGNQNAIFDEIGNAFSDFGQSMQAMGSNQVCKTSRYFISVVKRFLYPINIYADVVTFCSRFAQRQEWATTFSAGHIALFYASREQISVKESYFKLKNYPLRAACGPRAVCCTFLT
jgi:hypothetical protein